MRRTVVAPVGVALVAAAALVTGQAGAGSTDVEVTVVHAIGPNANAVDVYVDGALALENFEFELFAGLGPVAPGTYNVQLCNHVGAAVDPLPAEGCPNGSVNSNAGTDVTVPAGADSVTLVAAYSGPDAPEAGRPTVVAFENDLSCVEDGDARVTAAHAAWAPEVDVLADGSPLAENLAFGESATADVPAGSYDVLVELASDGTDVLSLLDTELDDLHLTAVYVVGNPQQDAPYSVIVDVIDLEPCPVDTTTTTTTTSTTTTTIQTTTTTQPAAQPQTLTPRFTG